MGQQRLDLGPQLKGVETRVVEERGAVRGLEGSRLVKKVLDPLELIGGHTHHRDSTRGPGGGRPSIPCGVGITGQPCL